MEKLRLTAHISEEVYDKLMEFIEKNYKSKHGSISWVVEIAIEEYLEKKLSEE